MAEPEREGAVEGRTDDWGQVVTRYPYENVGMDHLLSKEKDVQREMSVELTLDFLFGFEGSLASGNSGSGCLCRGCLYEERTWYEAAEGCSLKTE